MSSWTLGKVLRRWSCKDWWIDVWERKKAAWASGRLDLQLTQTGTSREAGLEGKIKSSVSTYQVWCDYCTCNWMFQVDKWIYMSGNQKRGLGRKDVFWLSALRWHWRCHKTTCDHLNCECRKGKEETPKVSLGVLPRWGVVRDQTKSQERMEWEVCFQEKEFPQWYHTFLSSPLKASLGNWDYYTNNFETL